MALVTLADGTAERRGSQKLCSRNKPKKRSKRITVGEDKAMDTSDHIAALRRMNVTPHVAQNDSLTKTASGAAVSSTRARPSHLGYQISQTGWGTAQRTSGRGKLHGTMRKVLKHRGHPRWVSVVFTAQSHRLQSRAHSEAPSPPGGGVRPNPQERAQRDREPNNKGRTPSLPQVQQTASCRNVAMVELRMGAVTWAVRQRPVSHPRSSNRTCQSPASGSPTGFTPWHTTVQ